MALGDFHQDAIPASVDSTCVATLVETLEAARTPRLNAVNYSRTHPTPPRLPIWPLFDGTSATPFTTAANLTPIPPGPTTVITLLP